MPTSSTQPGSHWPSIAWQLVAARDIADAQHRFINALQDGRFEATALLEAGFNPDDIKAGLLLYFARTDGHGHGPTTSASEDEVRTSEPPLGMPTGPPPWALEASTARSQRLLDRSRLLSRPAHLPSPGTVTVKTFRRLHGPTLHKCVVCGYEALARPPGSENIVLPCPMCDCNFVEVTPCES